MFHRREDRIRAHVQLCWLALLLIRATENTTDQTWRNLGHELDRIHLVTLAPAEGQVAQRTSLTAGQKAIFAALELPQPRRFHDFIHYRLRRSDAATTDAGLVVTRPLHTQSAYIRVITPQTPDPCAHQLRNSG